MNIWIGRQLFQAVALPCATAVAAHATGTCALASIDTLSFTLYQSLAAFGLPPQAVYFVCFSPAFVFENLPRGPPGSARYLQEIELIRAYLIRKARKRRFVK